MPYRGRRRRKEKKIEEDGEEEAAKHRQRESYLGVHETEPKSRWMEQRIGSRGKLGFAKLLGGFDLRTSSKPSLFCFSFLLFRR